MRKYLTFILLIATLKGNSQELTVIDTIDKAEWSCEIISLPTVIFSYESYKMTHNTFKHKYAKGKRKWGINYKKRKLFKVGDKKTIIKGLDYFLHNKNNDFYCLALNTIDKQKFVEEMKKNDYLNLNESILNKYLILDTLKIQFQEFNTEYSKVTGVLWNVIDGAEFTISLDLMKNRDTTKYTYEGNLHDGVKDIQVNNFLLYYDLNKKYKVFANLRISDYFNDENYYNVILRYIAYKEGTFERKLTDEEKNFNK